MTRHFHVSVYRTFALATAFGTLLRVADAAAADVGPEHESHLYMRSVWRARLKSVAFCISLLAAVGAPATTAAQQRSQTAQAQNRLSLPQDWTVFWGQEGLVLPHPKGWQVQEQGHGAFVVFRPGSGNIATAITFALPIADLSAEPNSVLAKLGEIAPEFFPGVRVGEPQVSPQAPAAALAPIRFSVQGRAFRGTALCIAQQRRGMLYVMAAQEQSWPSEASRMTRILTSFFYSSQAPGAQAGPSAALPEMVTWRDPTEGAFTVPAPVGWQVTGGVQRVHPLDLRIEVVATSPDGSTVVRLGDASVPPMRVPDQMMQGMGFREESWYTPGVGFQVWLLRYLPAPNYLLEYYLPARLGELNNVNARDYPELSHQAEAQWRQATLGVIDAHYDTADLTFEADNAQRKGYAFAQTRMDSFGSVAGWYVTLLFGYLSTPQNEAQAAYVLQKMVSGFALDPAWHAERLKTEAIISGIIHEHNTFMNDMLDRNYRAASASEQRISEARTRAIRGETVVLDPTTGTERTVPSGHNYYWLSGPDQVIGSETADPALLPNTLLQQLEIVR